MNCKTTNLRKNIHRGDRDRAASWCSLQRDDGVLSYLALEKEPRGSTARISLRRTMSSTNIP